MQQHQQPPQQQMMNIAPSFPPTAITTEQIQKYLDENKQLILAILENQNLGKLTECAQYQAQLQKNLIYLAAIADAQPPAPTVPTPAQMPMHPAMQQGHYMQHPQAAAAAAAAQQQPGIFGAKMPFQLTEQQQHHLLHLQQQQPIQGLMGMRPIVNNGMHQTVQTGLGALGGLMDMRGSKPDGLDVGPGDGQGKSASGHGSGNRDSYIASSEMGGLQVFKPSRDDR